MPTAEGWTQQMGPDGRPSLQFESPRGAKPPVHWADLSIEDREAKVIELGLPKFRAKQLSTHYFTHYTSNPDHTTDLPAETRPKIVGQGVQTDRAIADGEIPVVEKNFRVSNIVFSGT